MRRHRDIETVERFLIMPRYKVGDRVQLAGDIARFYACIVGVVDSGGADSSSLLVQYDVRLADGAVATFFDFQLQSSPFVRAQVVVDGSISTTDTGPRGALEGRHIRFVAAGVGIHLKISDPPASVVGEVTAGKTAIRLALVTLLIDDQPIGTKPTDDRGEFEFREVPAGDAAFEVFLPGKRIVASVSI